MGATISTRLIFPSLYPAPVTAIAVSVLPQPISKRKPKPLPIESTALYEFSYTPEIRDAVVPIYAMVDCVQFRGKNRELLFRPVVKKSRIKKFFSDSLRLFASR